MTPINWVTVDKPVITINDQINSALSQDQIHSDGMDWQRQWEEKRQTRDEWEWEGDHFTFLGHYQTFY